jgi:hypothetical protein
MHITSTVFQDGEEIPKEHSYDGGNQNPPLTFSEVPREAKSLVLIVEDPDAPSGTFTHWILYNMSPATLQIPKGQLPLETQQATNDFGQIGYGGPKPPSGTHRYAFKLFALDTTLDGVRPTDKRPVLDVAMKGHVIDQAQLVGIFSAG